MLKEYPGRVCRRRGHCRKSSKGQWEWFGAVTNSASLPMAGGEGAGWVQIWRHTGSVTLGYSPYLPGPDILSRHCRSPTSSRPHILAAMGLILSPAQGREASLTGRVLAEVTHRNPCVHFSHWFRYRHALQHWHRYLSLPNKPPHPFRQQRYLFHSRNL